ncbi:hypothetical protein E3O45_01060 [Cryobacterium sp. TMS1-20-1]|uniref:hypothetical protein n=1 Tax=unclassified Cryobacterium TaxID=2649013 RepID=UPI00106D10DA|nr:MULTISPECIES: hypothetical protein [unclassified Cryobacterium]TFC81533.1 hypothetical protein E3O45_01060 [Cryobacterium sp. TMS1-20-1]TFD51795.1 hypothetical protein E3T43_16070 [Cryobacterium sp. Hh7]
MIAHSEHNVLAREPAGRPETLEGSTDDGRFEYLAPRLTAPNGSGCSWHRSNTGFSISASRTSTARTAVVPMSIPTTRIVIVVPPGEM